MCSSFTIYPNERAIQVRRETYRNEEHSGWDVDQEGIADDHVENPSYLPAISNYKMESGVENKRLARDLS